MMVTWNCKQNMNLTNKRFLFFIIFSYLVGLELPEGDIDGDTSFSLGLQLVQNPSVLEGTFTHLMGFL